MLANAKILTSAILEFTPQAQQPGVHTMLSRLADPAVEPRNAWTEICASLVRNISEHEGADHGDCVTASAVKGIIVGIYMAKWAQEDWFKPYIESITAQRKAFLGENVESLFGEVRS